MEERIKYLFQLYLDNTCSREEMDELFSLIKASGDDETLRSCIRKAYEEMLPGQSLQTYVDEAGHLVLTNREWVPARVAIPEKLRRGSWLPGLVVAICFLFLGLITWLAHHATRSKHTTPPAIAAVRTKKATERSESKYILLPDSTQVWLNASSTLEYPQSFGTGPREVTLSGEAWFDVKHADRSPFLIHTGKVSTTVLGTAFNIKAYPDWTNIIVAVSRGKVRVSYDDKVVATLVQGEMVRVNPVTAVREEKKVAPAEVASWQQGKLSFEDIPLEEILHDLERQYNVRIRLDNTADRQIRVSTGFRREIGIEQALQILCQLTDTRFHQESGWYIIQ